MEDGIRFIRQGERFVGLRCQAEKRSLGIILHGPAACQDVRLCAGCEHTCGADGGGRKPCERQRPHGLLHDVEIKVFAAGGGAAAERGDGNGAGAASVNAVGVQTCALPILPKFADLAQNAAGLRRDIAAGVRPDVQQVIAPL